MHVNFLKSQIPKRLSCTAFLHSGCLLCLSKKATYGIQRSIQNPENWSLESIFFNFISHWHQCRNSPVTFQRLTFRGGVRSGRTSRRTCLWWGCRWGTRTSRILQGRRRREQPGQIADPGRWAGTRRSGLAFGTYQNARSWCMARRQRTGRILTQNHRCGRSCRSKVADRRRRRRLRWPAA